MNDISIFKNNNNNKFFFYEDFKGNSNQTRTQFIKENIEGNLIKYSNINNNKIKELIKILLFDINVKYIDDNDIGEFLQNNSKNEK